jgi:tetratricopeptide (TPR) repeat protein
MDPDYREMILGDEWVPIAELSGAFLSPQSDKHLQFAYYESSLVVEHLVDEFGLEALQAILRDLGEGREINSSIETHTAPLADLEKQFATFARERAKALAPELDWEEPQETSLIADQGETAWEVWAQSRPNNFYVLMRQASKSLEAQDWAGSLPVLEKLVERFPTFTGADSSWSALAAAYRGLGESEKEREALENQARIDDEAVDVYQRLMEIGEATGDWKLVAENANRYIAVNPLVPLPYRQLAKAANELNDAASAIHAYRALLALGPDNPALLHYQLARQLHALGDPAAKRHVLQALEDAPRFRAALDLLIEINAAEADAVEAGPEST